jgi:hypothetical protein
MKHSLLCDWLISTIKDYVNVFELALGPIGAHIITFY